jgi:MFS transporter, CP family, cyanate transporter
MLVSERAGGAPSASRVLELLCLLWLTGMAMRVAVLAVPPVIPLIRDELGMSETEVGLLIGLPIVAWAFAAVPGSLLVARLGATLTLVVGLAAAALAAAARAAAPDVWLLYLATILMGFGIAVTQPALPTLVREWLPHRIGLATAVSTNGIMVGVALGPALTIAAVLPLVGQSWRLDLVLWALPVLATALILFLFAPRSPPPAGAAPGLPPRWWPSWKDPAIWLLGLAFGGNNALFYGVNAFLPDYLASIGSGDLTGAALGLLNGCQLVASTLLLVAAEHVQRRAWPYLVFGPAALAGVLGIAAGSGAGIVIAAALVGFSLSVTLVMTLALPPVLSPPDDIHRLSAGMFTIGFACAVVIPTICGALWDVTGRPWTAFVPLGLCAVMVTALGVALSVRAARR